jgi:FKBP-type peptidyl-prolyl cis-trans isomerase SlyD
VLKTQVISFRCVLKDKVGTILSSTLNRDVITTQETHGDLLQGLLKEIRSLKKGEKRRVVLSAEQAYGFYDPHLVVEVARKRLPQGKVLQVGHQILTHSREGESKVFRVIQSSSKSVTLDGNHPLAGQDLVFEIEGIECRDATSEDIARLTSRSPSALCH